MNKPPSFRINIPLYAGGACLGPFENPPAAPPPLGAPAVSPAS
jgi:hypothetical protein